MAATMGPQGAQHFHRFKHIRLADAIGADDEKSRLGDRQRKKGLIPEPLHSQLLKLDGSLGGFWLRYLLWDG